jgi:hypothetical protein
MSIYAHIKRCLELSERDIVSAVADRRTAKALLDQLAKVSRPGDGAPKLLLVFARLASSEVEWIDGALRVEMVGDADATVVEVLCELGLGMRERVFPSFKMNVPLDEFARAVERVPHMVAPLAIGAATSRRLILTAAEDEEQEEAAPPPAVSIGDDSLYVRRSSKDKIAAVKDPRTRIEPRAASSGKVQQVRKAKSEIPAERAKSVPARSGKTLRPAPPPADGPAKAHSTRPDPWPSNTGASSGAGHGAAARVPAVPKPPALPRTDASTPTPPPPAGSRAVVARVPLTRIQVPRGSRPPAAAAASDKTASHARPSKHPKRPSLKPAAKGHSKAPGKTPSKPPERRSKAPPPRSVPPKSARSRAPAALSEPPDEEGIDMGWDEGNKE